MKSKYFLLISFLFITKILISQELKILQDFKNYFTENAESLDQIEGLWDVTINMETDHVVAQPEEFLIAIVKKKEDYFQYMIEFEKYIPTADRKRFVKENGSYKCKEFDSRCGLNTASESFIITNKQFSFDLEYTAIFNCYAKAKLADSVVKKYTYTKAFPENN